MLIATVPHKKPHAWEVFLQDLNLTPRVDDHVEIINDNTAAIQFVKDSKFHKKTKHIKRGYHFVQDIIKGKEVVIKYISISKMMTDLQIKPIPRDPFKAMWWIWIRRV